MPDSVGEWGIIGLLLWIVVKPLLDFAIEKAKNGNGKRYDNTISKTKTTQMDLLKEMEKERRREVKMEEIEKMLVDLTRWLDESRQDNRTMVIAIEKLSTSFEGLVKSQDKLVMVTRNQEKHFGKIGVLLEKMND